MAFLQSADIFIQKSSQTVLKIIAGSDDNYPLMRSILIGLAQTKGLPIFLANEICADAYIKIRENKGQTNEEVKAGLLLDQKSGKYRTDNIVLVCPKDIGVPEEQFKEFAEEIAQEIQKFNLSVVVQI